MREERIAFSRLKDQIRKFRLLIPYISDRSETIEKKIERLMGHREEAEKQEKKLKAEIEKMEERMSYLERKRLNTEVRKNGLLVRYNSLLAGDIPDAREPASSDISIEALLIEKVKFLSVISSSFENIERELSDIETREKAIDVRKKKILARKEKLDNRLELASGKISLYRADIRKNLMELNNHLKNERELKKAYARIVSIMKKSPGLTEWGNEILKEVIKQKQLGKEILKLKSPVLIPPAEHGKHAAGISTLH
jgi:septal ring factor EnvC (AmiA/AmiB activator)